MICLKRTEVVLAAMKAANGTLHIKDKAKKWLEKNPSKRSDPKSNAGHTAYL
jgi:hypothetical protein